MLYNIIEKNIKELFHINLTNLLDYSNSLYDFSKKINNIKRKNVNAQTKPFTALKMLSVLTLTKTPSINLLMNGIHKSNTNRLKNVFSKNEFIPKTHPSFAVDLNLNTTLTQLSTAIFYVKFLYFLVVQLVYNVI